MPIVRDANDNNDGNETFAMVPERLLYLNVSDRAVRLYAVLARHARDKTGECYPGRERLADLLGCKAWAVDKAMNELKDTGEVLIRRRGQGLTNVYTLPFVRDRESRVVPLHHSESRVVPLHHPESCPDTTLESCPSTTKREPGEREPEKREPVSSAPSSPRTDAAEVEESLVAVFGPPARNKTARGPYARWARDLAEQGAAPRDVEMRGRECLRRYPDATPAALLKHWNRLNGRRSSRKRKLRWWEREELADREEQRQKDWEEQSAINQAILERERAAEQDEPDEQPEFLE